jgi:hypothetical protein
VRDYIHGSHFEHDAVPWLSFDLDEIFADLDILPRIDSDARP